MTTARYTATLVRMIDSYFVTSPEGRRAERRKENARLYELAHHKRLDHRESLLVVSFPGWNLLPVVYDPAFVEDDRVVTQGAPIRRHIDKHLDKKTFAAVLLYYGIEVDPIQEAVADELYRDRMRRRRAL